MGPRPLLATIRRRRAILQFGRLETAGTPARILWLIVHIYYPVGFKNRAIVVLQWVWAYFTFRRGARLIVGKDCQFHARDGSEDVSED